MDLPQELIDEIICNLASDVPSLLSCSLVAKSWIHPSRKWLFKDVLISKDTRQRWLDRIPPRNVELLQNIRSFTYASGSSVWHTFIPYRIETFRRYLPSLCHLESLGLTSMSMGSDAPQMVGLFSAFQHTLSALYLNNCHITPSALVILVNYFPLLTNLALHSLKYVVDDDPVPRLARPLRGRLAITYCSPKDQALFNQLTNPPPELDELVLCRVNMPAFYNIILGADGGSTKRLKMTSDVTWERHPFPTLSHCRGLRELEINQLAPEPQEDVLLFSSITSADLQKIVLPLRYGWVMMNDPGFARYNQTLDDCLCQHAQRLRRSGHKRRLEFVFRIGIVPDDEKIFEIFLPKFREQGRVKFVWEKGERVYGSIG